MGYLGTPPQSGFISNASNQYFTGITQNYIDLNQSIDSLSSVIILVNGVVQENADLTLTSSTRITLGQTTVASDKITCVYLGKITSNQAPATGSVTNDMLAGSIANSKLANSSITLNGSAVSLGGSASVGETMAPVFKAVLSGNQSINSASGTTIAFATEQLDTGGCYNTSNYRFTPNVEGWYYFVVSGLIYFGNNAGEYGDIYIEKVGSKVIANRMSVEGDQGLSNSLMCSGITHMNGTTDWVSAHIYHNFGSARDLDSNEDYTVFMGFRITGSV